MQRLLSAIATALVLGSAAPALAAEPALQPGEAFATRFSGARVVTSDEGEPDIVIDTDGVVGSIVDVRNPGRAPEGTHWTDEPQRAPVTAGQIGQVFGIAIDDAEPANIYLTATSAFGLHRTIDDTDWMPGMWGPQGGPGTVYRLSAENGYQPEVFAQITLDGRENTGAALGNIAYDPRHGQLFVSDLETGMIFRVDAESGQILDYYDHGVDGRGSFVDAVTGQERSLETVAFAPGSAANTEDCPGYFSASPECWNVADYRRRVWGLGLFPEAGGRGVRLYYAIWSADPLGAEGWEDSGVERRNSLWSVALGDDGAFDIDSVRREFILPDFDEEGVQNGAAVTDIAFSHDGTVVLAERGGLRNLGLDGDHPFATPQVSRVLQYRRREGKWEFLARFDVGFNDRELAGPPYIRANAAGGVDFGFGYGQGGRLDTRQRDAMLWATGDALCSPDGPCNGAGGDDDSQVHGLQGTPRRYDAELIPEAALADYPDEGAPYAPDGPAHSYLIDLDINVDAYGRLDERLASRDDTSMIGDVEINRGTDAVIAATEPPGLALIDEAPEDGERPEAGDLPQVVVPEPPGGVPDENYANVPDDEDAPDEEPLVIGPGDEPEAQAPQGPSEGGDPQLVEFHRRFESSWHDRTVSAPVHDGNVSHNRIGSERRSGDNRLDASGAHGRRASWIHFRNRSYRDLHSRWRSSFD